MRRQHLVLQDRDYALLKALSDYRYLSTSQIRARFFSKGPFVYRRLKKLADHRVIVRLQREVVGEAAELVHALSPEGARHLAQHTGRSVSEFAMHRKASRFFLEHELALNRFRFAFEEAVEKEPEVTIDQWTIKHSLPIPGGKKLIPDAYVILATPRGRAHFFVEVDQGTEPVPRIVREKLYRYAAYQHGGQFEKETGVRLFRVLTVTRSERTADRLLQSARQVAPPCLFWFSKQELVTAEAVLITPIWYRADRPDRPDALYRTTAQRPRVLPD